MINERIREELNRIAKSGCVASAYLITGGDFEERLKIAEEFAKKLVSTPADLIYPMHEKETLIGVKDVRSEITETVMIKPYGTGRKVYLVKDAEYLEEKGQNVLLKTLEEPPGYVTIILLAPDKNHFLPTVLSRAIKYQISTGETIDNEYEKEDWLLNQREEIRAKDIAEYCKQIKEEKTEIKQALSYIRAYFVRSFARDSVKKEADAKLKKESYTKIFNAIAESERRAERKVSAELVMAYLWEIIRIQYKEGK